MSRERFKQIDSLFVIRHAQRCDKVAQTTSSVNFHNHKDSDSFMLSDSYNPRLATFETTDNKSNNGYTQSMEVGYKIIKYLLQNHNDKEEIILNFHSSPYLRCLETIKFISDYIIRKHTTSQTIRIIISMDQFLSEWLNNDLNVNYFPPNDNGETLLTKAIQYLNSNLSFNHKNSLIKLQFDLGHDSYQNGNPGPFSESFLQHYHRLSNGLISVIKNENTKRSSTQTNILILVSHGACVRSLISKILNKPIYIEIPLASLSIVDPLEQPDGDDNSNNNNKKSIWKLHTTDIELKESTYPEVNIFKNDNPFKNFQFNQLMNSHLTFQSVDASPSKKDQFKIPAKLEYHTDTDDSDLDSDSDSDSEGLSFRVPVQRRPKSQSPSLELTEGNSNKKRFRSASLFGPTLKNPFFQETKSTINPPKGNGLIKNPSFNNKYQFEQYSPKDIPTPITTTPDHDEEEQQKQEEPSATTKRKIGETSKVYCNIDIDDGNYSYGPSYSQRKGRSKANSISSNASSNVPDLDEMYSSDNSSYNSLHETFTNNDVNDNDNDNANNNDNDNDEDIDNDNDSLSTGPSTSSNSMYQNQELNDSTITIKPSQPSYANPTEGLKSSTVLFDKSLIEKSIHEMSLRQDAEPSPTEDEEDEGKEEEEEDNSFLTFGSGFKSSGGPMTKQETKPSPFKIELYERKNRFTLNLYGDGDDNGDDNGDSGGWFMGSNKY